MLNGIMDTLDELCMGVTGAAKTGIDAYGELVAAICKPLGPIGAVLNELCMGLTAAGKLCVDAYAAVVYAITGAIGKLGSGAGASIALGGALTIAISFGGGTQQPSGPLLGKPYAPETTAASPSAEPTLTQIASTLPGAI